MTDIEYLNKVINIKDINDLYNNDFCWLYPFSNENIKGYYDKINFKDKNVLTVTSSGDHAINAFIYGAKNVDTFDFNPLAKYYVELKIAGIKSLSLKEFIMFFYNKNVYIKQKHYFDKVVYIEKLRPFLNSNNQIFWDYVFNNFSYKNLHKSYLFTDDFLDMKGIFESNLYLKEYNKTKEILLEKNITYYDKNINDLDEVKKIYDVIILSNIPSFLSKKELIELKKILENIKNNKTQIMFNYYYYNLLENGTDKILYNEIFLEKYLKEYKYYFFESSDNLVLLDAIRKIYHKRDMALILK